MILAWVVAAAAFAPDAEGGVSPSRVYTFGAGAQAEWARQPGWSTFTAGEGRGWRARFDEATGTPHRMWGRLDLGPIADAGAVEAALRRLIARHPRLFGTDGHDLALRSAAYIAARDTWFVEFDRTINGVPIWGGGVTARVVHGALVLVGVDTYPGVSVAEPPRVTRAAAGQLARGWPALANRDVTLGDVQPALLPDEDGRRLRPVWTVAVRAEGPLPVDGTVMIDQTTGAIAAAWSDVCPIRGTLWAEVPARTKEDPREARSVAFAALDDGAIGYTDVDGQFAIDAASATATLAGREARITNEREDDASIDLTDGDVVWRGSAAEHAAYAYLTDVHAWGSRYAPDAPYTVNPTLARVNLPYTCNAYFDPADLSVNFFARGSRCANTAEIADIVYHEWGHGLHWTIHIAGSFDTSISEGVADSVAAFLTRDPIIAPTFYTTGAGVREIETDRIYPRDYAKSANAEHQNGLIFGGVFWDLTQTLIAHHGHEAGRDLAQTLFVETLRGGPGIETAFDETTLADDDNADLSDGTPHWCDIVEAYGRHGLGPNGDVALRRRIVIDPPALVARDAPQVLPGRVEWVDTECDVFGVATGDLAWRRGPGAAWAHLAFDVQTDGSFAAPLPAVEDATVQYFITVQGDAGRALRWPPAGAELPASVYLGDTVLLSCEDFEKGDAGYVATGDWERGAPAGKDRDPESAHSGNKAWGNNLLGSHTYAESTLTMPPLDATALDGAFLVYHRWLTVDDGRRDHATITANGRTVWENEAGDGDLELADHIDSAWVPHVVDLNHIGDHTPLSITWGMKPDATVVLGGWNIDDVCVAAPLNFANALRIDDFSASDDAEVITLRWTQPAYGPLVRVIVVRRSDGYPLAPDDGEIVVELADATPGAVVEIVDATAPVGTHFYATFAWNGRFWTEGVVEGGNADKGTHRAEEQRRGACTTSATPPGLLGLVALGATVRRRRAARVGAQRR